MVIKVGIFMNIMRITHYDNAEVTLTFAPEPLHFVFVSENDCGALQ